MLASGGAFAFVFCRTFEQHDVRLEPIFAAIERVTKRRFTHFVADDRSVRKIPVERIDFVSTWLPLSSRANRAQMLCGPKLDDATVFAHVSNVDGKFSARRGDSLGGAIRINSIKPGLYDAALASGLEQIVQASKAFHAVAESMAFVSQRALTRQFLDAQLQAVEGMVHLNEVQREAERKRILKDKSRYVFSLETGPLQGIAPDGRAFDMQLGTVNFWNDATLQALGLPDREFEARFAGLYSKVPDGWIVRLATNLPDLTKEADRTRIEWLYRRMSS